MKKTYTNQRIAGFDGATGTTGVKSSDTSGRASPGVEMAPAVKYVPKTVELVRTPRKLRLVAVPSSG